MHGRKNYAIDYTPPNIASENVMKRIGMTFEGLFMHPALADGHWLKTHKLYSIDL